MLSWVQISQELANFFRGRSVLSTEDFNRKEFEFIMDTACVIDKYPERFSRSLEGKMVALLFFEPSTRTYGSFDIATKLLGGYTTDIKDPQTSSLVKGESLTDTIGMFSDWGVDCIVIRHKSEGAARLASEIFPGPVINGGDGANHHPTQAMLDLGTIRNEKGHIDNLKIAIAGDLRFGRTVPSLSFALSNYKVELTYISPKNLTIKDTVREHLKSRNVPYTEFCNDDIEFVKKEIIPHQDVLYVTRIQKERFPDPFEYEKVKGSYVVNLEFLKHAKKDLIVMHPLPRVNELAYEVDSSQFARYHQQAAQGPKIRKALLHLIIGDSRISLDSN